MTRIFIENQELDINAELTNQITYSIDDIVNIDSKSTSFTKTIIIPGTARNNKIFGNIFEFTNSNLTDDSTPNVYYNYNASKSAKAMIEMNGLQVMKGVMRLMSIVVDGVNVEYEIVLFGELGGFVSALGNKRIEDIDFSAYDHEYSLTNITNSWINDYEYLGQDAYFSSVYNGFQIDSVALDKISVGDQIFLSNTSSNDGLYNVINITYGNPFHRYTRVYLEELVTTEHAGSLNINSTTNQYGAGYIYPLIDYGKVSTNKHDYSFRAFRPALFVKEYMDRIINDAGYTYDSLFFDTSFFRRLIVPNNDAVLQQRGTNVYVDAYSTSDDYNDSTGRGGQFIYNLDWDTPAILNNFTYSAGEFESIYTAPINTKITFTIEGTYKLCSTKYIDSHYGYFPYAVSGTTSNYFNSGSQIQLRLIKDNGTILGTYQGFINGTIDGVSCPADYLDVFATIEVNAQIDPGEKIRFEVLNIRNYSYSYEFELRIANISLNIKTEPEGFIEYELNNTILMNTILPRNVFQKDFFTSIMKMFNLMVVEDKYKSKHLHITPYIDYYNLVNYNDWSNKLNRAKPITIKPMSETNARYYEFDYKSDSDYYNELYKKKWNQIYGNRIFDNQLEFATENKKLEVIFSPSVLVGYNGEDKVVSAIFKKTNDLEENLAHNIRVMQVKHLEDIESWDILDGDLSTVLENRTDYLYAGHFDNPDLPAADLNFGATNELFYLLLQGSLQNNLFNAFYSVYMAEITDKNSRLVTAEMYLTEKDVFNINFSKFIYLDGALYRLIKIADWSVDNLCKIDLLRVINTSYNSSTANIPYVKVCGTNWSAQNLNVSKYANGDDIPEITNSIDWENATSGAWCYYNNDASTESKFGKLYNWFAVNDPRGLAPTGWKIPTYNEAKNILDCNDKQWENLASTETTYGSYDVWQVAGTNTTGFNAIGVGSRIYDGLYIFDFNGLEAGFWTSTNINTGNAYFLSLYYSGSFQMVLNSASKLAGYSVRLTLA